MKHPDTTYRGFRSAGTRLTEAPLAHLDFHRSSLLGESVHAIHAFDKAHAVMLTETGIIPRDIGAALLSGLLSMEEEGVAQARNRVDGGMHSGEHYLIHTLGEDVGGYLHIGRSSGDLAEVARRLTIRNHVHRLMAALCDVRQTLIELAGRHCETVMPGYTHGQHAQPTTFAHWLTMFEAVFARDMARLVSFHARLNSSPAGAAILTGSDFPIDRHRVSQLLGFDQPLPHTMDAILSQDLLMEYVGVLATLGQGLARMADDLFLWSTTEFAMVELPDRYCGTSSIMPQKKNPDGLEDMKSISARAMGAVTTVMVAERGPTGFPIMERRSSQAILWELGRDLSVRLETLGPLLRDLKVHDDRMLELAGANWAQVTDLAGALVRNAHIAWRTAHQIVAVFVRQSKEAGVTPSQATSRQLDAAAKTLGHEPPELSAAAFAEAMNPAAFVKRRILYGGPAPTAVANELVHLGESLEADRQHVHTLVDQAAAAHQMLQQTVRSFAKQGES